MKKTTSTILFVLVMMISVLITSCTTVRSAALGVGTSAGLAIGSDDVQPSVDVGITYTETFQRQRINGTLGPLRISMGNISYSILSKSVAEEVLFGWAFDINLNNPNAKLSIGFGPYLHGILSTEPYFQWNLDMFGLGTATTLRFNTSGNTGLGIVGFVSAGVKPIFSQNKVDCIPAIRGGVYFTILTHKEEFGTETI